MLAVDVLSKKLQRQSLEDQQKALQDTQIWKVSVNSQTYKSLVAKQRPKNRTKDKRSTIQPDLLQDLPKNPVLKAPPTPPTKKHCSQSFSSVESDVLGGIQDSTLIHLSGAVKDSALVQPSGTVRDSALIKPVAVIAALAGTDSLSSGNKHACDISNTKEHLSVAPWSVYQETCPVTSCEFQTPPESPIPRPSSASTCGRRYDGAFSPIGVQWLDHNIQSDFQLRPFKNRSLSFEDEILSTPAMTGHFCSVPTSPQRDIPRCRSQPTFIHDRKCGLKRRRNERPTLNFQKMTKTAYIPFSPPSSNDAGEQCQKRPCHARKELESVMGLMPIASSPMDSESILLKHKRLSETDDICDLDLQGPIKLIGEDDSDNSFCNDDDKEQGVFHLQEELDIEQIETH